MDRLRHRSYALAACLAAGMVCLAGCNMVATALYVFQGQNEKAEFGGLREKRVAIVCRPITTLQYRNSSVARDLAKHVGITLEKNVPDIIIVPQREVAEWEDENNWEEYVEIGKALNADMVVGLDLEEFSLYQGQTLYQGKANVSMVVYDVAKGGEPVFEKQLPQAHFPPNSAIPASEKPEGQFRAQFVQVLAEQIGRYFYDHDSTVEFASDSKVLN